MDKIFSYGVCVEEILKFSVFADTRKFARINRTWLKSCQSIFAWIHADYLGYQVNWKAVKIPIFTQTLKIDIPPEEFIPALKAFLALSHLQSIEIYQRLSDGSVQIPQKICDQRFSYRDLAIQFPITDEVLEILKNQTNFRSLKSLTGVFCKVSSLRSFLKFATNLQILQLGYVDPSIDFDQVTEDLLRLPHLQFFQADDLNISLENVHRLIKQIKYLHIPAIWLVATSCSVAM